MLIPHVCVAVLAECKFKPMILNAEVTLDHGRLLSDSQEGDEGTVACKSGYLSADSRASYRIMCNKYGMWTTLSGSPFQRCDSEIRCHSVAVLYDLLHVFSTGEDPCVIVLSSVATVRSVVILLPFCMTCCMCFPQGKSLCDSTFLSSVTVRSVVIGICLSLSYYAFIWYF